MQCCYTLSADQCLLPSGCSLALCAVDEGVAQGRAIVILRLLVIAGIWSTTAWWK